MQVEKSRPLIAILVPITSKGFRGDALEQEYRGEHFDVKAFFLESGPVSVESSVDEVLAGPGLIAACIKAERLGASAHIVDCMLDPTLEALIEVSDKPVLGCGQTAMVHAAREYGSFSIVTVLSRQERLFQDKARLYGVSVALKSVRSIAIPVLDLKDNQKATLEKAVQESKRAIEEDGAKSIVFGCTGMMGLGGSVKDALRAMGHENVAVIDPLPFAVAQAVKCIESEDGYKPDRTLYPKPERKGYQGLTDWPELNELLR